MAEYSWTADEKAYITLGMPYVFTAAQYEYCRNRQAPIAIIYYDSKTSAESKTLYLTTFSSKDSVNALYKRLSSEGACQKGYCCLFVLDRCGNMSRNDDNLNYFLDGILKGRNVAFPALALSYGGKIYCHHLPVGGDITSQIYALCESGGGSVPKFSGWAGRAAWLDRQISRPDQETKSEQTTINNALLTEIQEKPPYIEDPPAKKTLSNYDGGKDGSFNGIETAVNRDGMQHLLNLADISTPETSYFLCGSYDSDNKSNCPWRISESLLPYMEKICDTVETIKNTACITNDGFKNLFVKGQKYRYFAFFEFSHGHEQSITIGIKYSDIWDTFKEMTPQQRVWGLFDSCHSGSMIVNVDFNPYTESAGEESAGEESYTITEEDRKKGIFYFLETKFEERTRLMRAVSAKNMTAAAVSNTNNVRLALWSSTGRASYGWYSPKSTTVFMSAFDKIFSTSLKEVDYWWKDDGASIAYTHNRIRYGWAGARDDSADYKQNKSGKEGEQAFRQLQLKGTDNHKGPKPLQLCIPQCRYYPSTGSFSENIIFY